MNAFQSEAVTAGEALQDLVRYYAADGRAALQAAARLYRDRPCRRLAFAGMGSSYSAPFAVLDELAAGGIPAVAVTAHKLGQDRAVLAPPDTLVVGISKSGGTRELLELADTLGSDAALISIVNWLDSDLAKRSRVSLPMKAGAETQIASKSFICSVAILNLLAAVLTGASLPDRLASLQAAALWAETNLAKVAKGEGELPGSIAACTHMDIVASGASFSTAYKSALVAREVPRIFASAIDCADYAHGWAKTIGPGYLGVVLAPEYRAGTIEERAVRQILDRGGEVVVITGSAVPSAGHMAVLQHPVMPGSVAPLAQAVILDAMIGAMANAKYPADHGEQKYSKPHLPPCRDCGEKGFPEVR
jgi:glucosamine--fructose-6-phosphate aminotransferase (isomerizing)